MKVDEVLSAYAGAPAYFESGVGNNGDELIKIGCEIALSRAQIDAVCSIDQAQLVIIRGGGSMNDFSSSGLNSLKFFLARRPDCPLVVLPQSYKFSSVDFGELFSERTAPAYLFAREMKSFEVLKRYRYPASVRIGVDHDMATWLRGSPFLAELASAASNEHVLIVERTDREGTSGLIRKPLPFKPLKRLVPQSMRMSIKRALRKRTSARFARTPFARQVLKTIEAQNHDFLKLPLLTRDISDRGTATFQEFCSAIARSCMVASNRLHVGVLAALLGKHTLLYEGSYHKIKGVYEYSLSDLSHVELVP